jgi:hypothetical protein
MHGNNEIELFAEHIPPNLEWLFGYQGSKRWVAFFWGAMVDRRASGYCFDGDVFNPLNTYAWDTFFSHSLIVAMNHKRIKGHAIKRFDFGDMLHTSRHYLLLDRLERLLHAAHKPIALEYLTREQVTNRGHLPPDSHNPSIFRESVGQASPSPTGALQKIAEMIAWLDDCMAMLEKMGHWPKLS